MAIKVRHDGNAAATAAAGLGSGRAKRRVETAKLAQNTPQHIQTLGAAHASAPGAGGGSAPLTHAPSGASGASAPLIQGHGGGGGRSGLRSGGSGGAGSGAGLGGNDYKVTGTSIFTRPDKDSQWDPGNGGRWIRPWLPGEKEAEAAQRMNPVIAEREQDKQDIADASAKEMLREKQAIASEAAEAGGRRALGMLGAKSQMERELYDYKLSQKQKMEIAAVTDAVDSARRSGRFTPEEMDDIERQATVKLMGIKPLPTPRERDAQQAFNDRIVTAGGVQGYINSKGDFEPFQKDDGFANFLKVYPKLAEYTEDEVQTDPKTGKQITVPVTKTRTAEEIARLVTGAQAAWNKARRPAEPQTQTPLPDIDPIVMQAVAPQMFQQLYGGGQQAQPVGPLASQAPKPPATPEEMQKKWSAFKAQ